MSRIAYLDIIGGISGDMYLAAMIDAGLSRDDLASELAQIVPPGFHIETRDVSRGAIRATHANIELTGNANRHVGWQDFDDAIENSELPTGDLGKIRAIFDQLKKGEAQAHCENTGATHLHELGSMDTLIDVSGAVIGLRLLGVEALYASPIPASVGMSSSSHGKGASFAPATMSIIRDAQIPVRVGGSSQPKGESVTPTGAAIVATLATFKPADIRIESVGYGAGTRDSDNPPNVVGIWIGESNDHIPSLAQAADSAGVQLQSDTVLIETNLDNMTGEETGYAIDTLFAVGALDVWTTPIQMKKSRPAITLSAICKRSIFDRVAAAIFEHTSTLGIRFRPFDRLVAEREIMLVQTEYGEVRMKLRRVSGVITQAAPEYEDCAGLAAQNNVPIRTITQAAQRAYDNQPEC